MERTTTIDDRSLVAELGDLRRRRESLMDRAQALRGRPRRVNMDELRKLTRRELEIEAHLLPRAPRGAERSTAPASAAVAPEDDDGQLRLRWWDR